MIQEANEETFFIVGEVSRRIMAAFLALIATILTSFLPILNKRILHDARPALVAWVVNAASLPLLALQKGGEGQQDAVHSGHAQQTR